MGSTKRPTSCAASILRRIRAWGAGTVFVPRDFLDLGARGAVDVALHRLAEQGTIRRLGRGLYDLPEVHPRLGALSPALDAVAHALARSHACTITPSEAACAQSLGVSTQVPAQAVYLTDGPSRTVTVDARTVRFSHASPGRRLGGDTKAGAVLRALRFLGRDDVTDSIVRRLQGVLDDADRRALQRLRIDVPAWMRPIVERIVARDSTRAA
ncbi:MAG: hypothetical protein HZA53_16135 [Planctomycetes bacterium]|nr:hypothetical protein [Planctomycetota bacterium]